MSKHRKTPTRKSPAPARAGHKRPSHRSALPALKKIQGQLGGIQQMIEDGRYCVDILIQCRAAMAALRSVETKIFQHHLAHCVEEAFMAHDEKGARKKIDELTNLLAKRTTI